MRMMSALIGSVVLALLSNETPAVEQSYPNELPGFKFHATARWRTLRPFLSTANDVKALLGSPEPVFFDAGPEWKYIVYYWGENGHCDGKPFPKEIVGTVISIELVPKARVSFRDVRFPDTFEKTERFSSHDPVGSWDAYSDDFGLSYEVYNQDSERGSEHAGDLKSIIYGPSRRLYAERTGCAHEPAK